MNPLRVYGYLGPLVLTPLSLWLWWSTYHAVAPLLVAWAVPIAWAWIVPGVGTNVLGTWEFDTRFRLGRFRPHHGFVFGSATATLGWLARPGTATSLGDVLRLSLTMACVLGFINLLYDLKALEIGLLRVHNEPAARGEGPAAVALDYAPWFFGGFGAVYGFCVGWTEWRGDEIGFVGALAASIIIPVAGYVWRSRRRHGHWGVLPVRGR